MRPPRTDLTPVVEAIADAEAEAFVAVGDRFDDDLRYLTRFSGPDRAYGVVVVPGAAGGSESSATSGEAAAASDNPAPPRAVLLAPALFAGQAAREFVDAALVDGAEPDRGTAEGPENGRDADAFHDGVVRAVRTEGVGDPVGRRAAAAIDDFGVAAGDPDGDARVLTPRSIPHDAAVYLERAGRVPASTAVVESARATKTAAEIERSRTVQRAAAAGMARAESILAASEPAAEGVDDDADGGDDAELAPPLRWDGSALTTERLRRAVNAVIGGAGARDAGNTVIGAGPTAADLHYVGDDVVRAGETVLLDLSPRGPDGYYADLTRTFVVDGDGGWARRAYVAVEAARTAALAEVEPGVTAGTVHAEAAAELGAYGFDPTAGEGEAGFTHGTGHGVGVSLHEGPSLSGDAELRPGHVVTVEPGVYDPAVGGVRLEDLIAVTDDGYEILAEYPFGIAPSDRE